MAKKERQMINPEVAKEIGEPVTPHAARKRLERPRTNITYIVLRGPHRALRQYALTNEVSLQTILDDLMERFFEEKGLGPFERATGGQ